MLVASVSINTKGNKTYAKFNDGKFPCVHLGKDKKHCIMALKRVFANRNYIEQHLLTDEDLNTFIKRINDNFKD